MLEVAVAFITVAAVLPLGAAEDDEALDVVLPAVVVPATPPPELLLLLLLLLPLPPRPPRKKDDMDDCRFSGLSTLESSRLALPPALVLPW